MRPSTIWYVLKQGIKNIKSNWMFSMASILTMAACIFLFGIFYSIVNNVNYLTKKMEQELPITVFFNEGTSEEAIAAVGEQIKARPEVARVEYESAEEAWEKSYVSVAVIVILLAISVFLISNTVSVGIAVRSEEIGIMKFIGATDRFVRSPFVLEGIVLGVIGAAIPLIGLYFVYNTVVHYILTKFNVLSGIVEFIPAGQIYQTLLPIGLALGVGIGLVGSFWTTRKHLRV